MKGEKPVGEKDIIEKTLESYNDVFMDIINGLLFEGRPVLQEHTLIDAQTFSMYKADGKLHEQERDISKFWIRKSEEKVYFRVACFGIENQTAYDADMPLRVIGYDGAAYRAEMLQERKERYPVVTLVLYFGKEHWKKNRTLYDVLDIPVDLKPYVHDYGINLFEISWLTEEQINYFQSDFRIAADYFVHKRTDPDYRPKDAQAIRHVDEFLKFMAVMTRDQRFSETIEWKEGEPKTMDEFLDGVEAKGEARGIEKATRMTAESMLYDRKPLEEIEKYSRLSETLIRELAEEIGVEVVSS